ncbi:N-acetyl-1-D-myo-inositol-2-amino-2-deoxy-alpha-D-glucopyranoside deacetylase [Actinopolyspora mortivallis]|uniref:1D-myo-inositol 2-acetamido-2-deoxy-alpha-D-glucopyranoside deacetylase n=1 Tax=Actinopolyspora mortivallis TaxID=33906 RepID=A0A2T0H0F6_ACTMO|nr:N-acetyl-1-D-myo-inositol-2-amino-2-deoxy-alpha-D-glucopyranoside deacetylase [Actinopolyspora mortivallis]PRW64848.1 N-acetyl-1-D-myo-inositol-2-amino-2-deoxy-alpha-D-glucopyranoside deacetylase [Actinopolyspora mortivallis]
MTLTTAPRLLLVHAHPDDETLWTGGTIARYAAAGVQVTLVTCTLGEEGEVIPPELRGLDSAGADQLGGYRVGELNAACAALGISDQRFLGGMGRWRDSGMAWQRYGRTAGATADTHPRALVADEPGRQAALLEEILREVRPQVVVTYDSDGGYGHPDHVRAHEITLAAAERVPGVERVFYAAPAASAVREGLRKLAAVEGVPFTLPGEDDLPTVDDATVDTVIDITPVLEAKLDALRAHRTQVSLWTDESSGAAAYALSNGIGQPVLGGEYYVLGSGSGTPRTDLFEGLDVAGGAPLERR